MLERLIKRLVTAKSKNTTDSDAKIAALEKEVEELRALVQKQANQAGKEEIQRTVTSQANASSIQVQCHPTEKASCFDMVEYFCNGHNDTAVDVIQYDSNGNVIMKKTFSWSDGCGEVTSDGIWKKANQYAQTLANSGIPCRKKIPICGKQSDEPLKAESHTTEKEGIPSAKAAYYDWEDTSWDNSRSGIYKIAVTVTQYDQDGNVIAREIFCEDHVDKESPNDVLRNAWKSVWEKADQYAENLKESGIPLRNEIRNGIKGRYSLEKKEYLDVPEKDMEDYHSVCKQPLGPFFPIGGAVLTESLGSWEKDVEEAQRRMDLFFSTAEAYKFARKRDTAAECKGSFRTKGIYDYTFWSREYFHSHDGWDIEGKSAEIIRISPKEFYYPSNSRYATERILAMCGEQNTRVRLNDAWGGEVSYEQLWKVPEGLEKKEQERYYLGWDKFRAKNFLGMVGYFEVCRNSF